ncbi:MAG: TIGR02757 family protein [Spirochaetales bacterium]|nr:TIGR02757 family protein [Spirochaetales bacterium]
MYEYDDPRDREIVGLITASISLGRVKSIVDAGTWILDRLKNPYRSLVNLSISELTKRFAGFKYRFYTQDDLVALLTGIRGAITAYGSLRQCFRAAIENEHQTTIPALSAFVARLNCFAGGPAGGPAGSPLRMVASPDKGSACKRLHLYLRWMIRDDAVDPGGWPDVPCSLLVVPMDVHMHSISLELGLTHRKQPDLRAALEVTDFFRSIAPDDPVKYDFCLTRMGIHPQLSREILRSLTADTIS